MRLSAITSQRFWRGIKGGPGVWFPIEFGVGLLSTLVRTLPGPGVWFPIEFGL